MMLNEYVNTKLLINSIIVGIMLSCRILLSTLSFLPNGNLLFIAIPCLVICQRNIDMGVNKKVFSLYFACFLFFFVFIIYSLIKGDFNTLINEYVLDFFYYGIPFLIISVFNISPLVVLRTVVVIYFLLFPLYVKNYNINMISYDVDGGDVMSFSYNLIRSAIPAIVLLFIDKVKWIYIISIILILCTVYFLINVGSRGAILSLILCLLFCLFYLDNKSIRLSYKFLFLSFILIFVILNFSYIVHRIYDLLLVYNVYSIPLERIIISLDTGADLDSGRSYIYDDVIQGFKDSPIFGNGIASFDNYSGLYPHNIFLQQLYEGGIVFGLPILTITLLSFKIMNSNLERNTRYFIVFLITASIPQLLLSSYFWSSHIYWYIFGVTLNYMCKDNCLKRFFK